MIHYRALFSDLLGEPDDAQTGPAAAEPAQAAEGDEMTVIEADDTTPGSSDAQIEQARPGVAAGDPGMDGAGEQLSGTGAGELTR
jgi:hypothetical protein